MSLIDRWTGRKRGYRDLTKELERVAERVSKCELHEEELPILRQISTKAKSRNETERQNTKSSRLASKGGVAPVGPSGSIEGELGSTDFAKTLDDKELYEEYSDVVLKSFPFGKLIDLFSNQSPHKHQPSSTKIYSTGISLFFLNQLTWFKIISWFMYFSKKYHEYQPTIDFFNLIFL